MRFKVMPTVDELCDELEAEGHVINREMAKALWGRAEVKMLAGSGRVSEKSLKLQERIQPEMLLDAQKKGVSLSALLEKEDPTEPGSRDEILGIDAFTRQLALLETEDGEALRVWPERNLSAHTIEEMQRAGPSVNVGGRGVHVGEVLFHELMWRAFDKAGEEGLAPFLSRNLFYSSSVPLWEGLNPQYLTAPIANQPRFRRPLAAELVAITSTVRAGEFRFPEIVDQPTESRYRRVAEGADVPLVRLAISQKSGSVHKFGIGIEVTDEAARRTPIDWMRFHVARIAVQNAEDETQVVIETLSTGAQNTDISTVGGVAGTVTSTPLDNFLGIFEEDGYLPTHCLGQRVSTTKLKNATTGTADQSVFRGPDRIMSAARPEEIEHPPIFSRSEAAADKLLYVDSSRALGAATEQGSEKEETDRNIRNGTNLIVLSKVTGWHTIDDDARRTLDIES